MSIKKYRIVLDGVEHEVEVEELSGPSGQASPSPRKVEAPAAKKAPASPSAAPAASEPSAGGNTVAAPLQGRILDVSVKAGDSVKSGQVLLIIEAMKMENEVVSPRDGVVASVSVSKGSTVVTGDPLVTLV